MKILTKHEERLKIYRDNYNTLEYAKKEGREEGRLQGREEGRVEGRIQGREEGRKEGRIEVAKAMLKNGMSIELIAELSGLSKAEIERLES